MDLLDTLLPRLRDEAPSLAARLDHLDAEATAQLEGVLGRFDAHDSGHLGQGARRDLIRLLVLLADPADATSLTWLNRALDYLDLNHNAKLEPAEYAEIMDIFDDFRRTDSDNLSLSAIELELLYAVLRHRDVDDSHRLERDERRALRAALARFDDFWATEVEENPRVREVLQQHGRLGG